MFRALVRKNPLLSSSIRTMTTEAESVFRPRRSLLYIPGSSEKMVAKSVTLGADTIVLDMEDGVAANAKELARATIAKALSTYTYEKSECLVRVNPMSTTLGVADLQFMLSQPKLPHGFVVPKLDSVEELLLAVGLIEQEEAVRRDHGENVKMALVGIIESPTAMVDLKDIMRCKAGNRLNAVIFGGDDYGQSVGATRTESNHEIQFARNWMMMLAAAHNIQAIDIVHKTFKDIDALRRECKEAAEMGYTGKQLIHPTQIAHANELFAPNPELLKWAKRVVDADAAHQAAGTGAFSLDGMMIDMPTVKLAEKIWNRGVACGVQI